MEKKVKQALALIRSAAKRHGLLEVAYSGGKDSDVILELVKMSGLPKFKNGDICYVKTCDNRHVFIFDGIDEWGYVQSVKEFILHLYTCVRIVAIKK